MITLVECSTCKISRYDIDGFLIVEGYSDSAFLSSFLNCQIIQVGGYALSRGITEYLVALSKKSTPIVFTDPDKAGETIRNRLLKILPNAKVPVVEHKNNPRKKNGIAECTKEEILKALSLYIIKGRENAKPISYDELISLNLVGPNSKTAREKVSQSFALGECNGKTFLKRINALNISFEELKKSCK